MPVLKYLSILSCVYQIGLGGVVSGLSESTKEQLGKWMGYGLGPGLWLGSG